MNYCKLLAACPAACSCGEEIVFEVHEDHSRREILHVASVHGRRYAQRLSEMAVHMAIVPGLPFRELAIRAQRALSAECPCRVDLSALVLGEVTESPWEAVEFTAPDGTRMRKMMRRERQQVSTPYPIAARKPTPPTCAVHRRILK